MRYLALVFGSIIMFSGCAQNAKDDKITINGIDIDGKYTREQMYAALGGEPTQVREPQPDEEYSGIYAFYYGDNVFEWLSDDTSFIQCTIRSSEYCLNGCVRVGDSMDKIKLLGGECRYEMATNIDGASYPTYIFWKVDIDKNKKLHHSHDVVFKIDENGNIFCIDIYILNLI